jgi:hypothetical protein
MNVPQKDLPVFFWTILYGYCGPGRDLIVHLVSASKLAETLTAFIHDKSIGLSTRCLKPDINIEMDKMLTL